ncbi:choline/carnitine O-acyltransferase [Saccharopolyspora sp. TS4A08]|uniref:Choline/carnitine O-acyltransferase n=1 Tax=Saccharopolyspora ipomoeae TaxID=3042027 RepID=A0ABT6PMK3_9PSEU|nr:choline/carnitine O-acyltransferase [Saccharopolyspora sp. TS4A08]MDI2029169.1 choline/carnitine O-acyltransferase [Saccharopolyspora sp. TS4A08]
MRTSTFGNEDSLPRIPLPTLADSGERFLQWCSPLLTEEELATTRQAVAEFLASDEAAELHDSLTAYAGQDDVHSWLDEFWRDRYLGRRDRIALNANFFFLFNDTDDDQISRAVRLIAAAVDHKLALDAETVPPTTRRGQPLSMQQHRYLFSTTRIPRPERDGVRAPNTPEHPGPSPARHIVVFFRGNAFRLDVIGADGAPHSLDELAEALRRIAATTDRGPGVGALTSHDRVRWAANREALLVDNTASVDVIETALFCLALEHELPGDLDGKCKQLLAGDPTDRWFDKGVTLIVFPDGAAGINGEHCLLDGTTIVEFVDSLMSGTAESHAQAAGATAQGVPEPQALEFRLSPELSGEVDAAAKDYVAYGEATATRTVRFDDFGSERAKALGISPDAFVQMAFQLAHRRSKGFTGATYESIATRHFHHGRTEAMRVVTPEVLEFVAAMEDAESSRSDRAEAFRRAADAHVTRAKECQAGDAPEQHLWELQLIAARRGQEFSPALYSSPGWLTMRDDYLSTSAAPSVNIQYFGFGATSEHCIGVAYVLLPQSFNVHLSTPRTVGEQMTGFAEQLGRAIDELSDLVS